MESQPENPEFSNNPEKFYEGESRQPDCINSFIYQVSLYTDSIISNIHVGSFFRV